MTTTAPSPAMRRVRLAICWVGVVVSLAATVPSGSFAPLPLFLIPYVAFLLATVPARRLATVAVSGLLVLALDLVAKVDILFFPSSSTAAIGLWLVPFLLAFVALPMGLALGATLAALLARTGPAGLYWEGVLSAVAAVVLATLILWGAGGPGCLGAERKQGVVIPSSRVQKAVVLEATFPGGIRAIQRLRVDDSPEERVAILSQADAFFLDAEGLSLVDTLELRKPDGTYRYVGLAPSLHDVDADGDFEIVQGGGGWGAIGLLDSEGRRLWSFERPSRGMSSEMIAADLDANGRVEFYAAVGEKLYRLGPDGRVIWQRATDSDVRDLAALQDAALAKNLVASLGEDGLVRYWDVDGSPSGGFTPPTPIRTVVPVFWPEGLNLLSSRGHENTVVVLDLEGRVLLRKELGAFVAYHGHTATAVRFTPSTAPHLAVLAHSSSQVGTSQLTILAPPEGDIVYQETLGRGEPVFAHNVDDGGRQLLLVGDGQRRLLSYTLLSPFPKE